MKFKSNHTSVIVDIDGVCLDYDAAFISFMDSKGIYMKRPLGHDIYTFEAAYDVDITQYIHEFNNSELFENLLPYKDSVAGLTKLCEMNVPINVVTAPGDSASTQKMRINNLKKTFGDVFSELHIIPLHACKKEYLNKLRSSNTIYVEDNVHHALSALEFGITPIIMGLQTEIAKKHGLKTAKEVNPWRCVVSHVDSMLQQS